MKVRMFGVAQRYVGRVECFVVEVRNRKGI